MFEQIAFFFKLRLTIGRNLLFLNYFRMSKNNWLRAKIVLEVESKTSIRDKTDNVIETTEILFTFNDL